MAAFTSAFAAVPITAPTVAFVVSLIGASTGRNWWWERRAVLISSGDSNLF